MQYVRTQIMLLSVLVALTTPDGARVWINPELVTSLRQPAGGAWPAGVRCLLQMADGKMVSVAEACDVAQSLLAPHKARP